MIHMRQTFITSKSIDHAFTETVNGPLYIPILGRLIPQLWGDRREVQRTRYMIHTDTGSFEVSEEEYDRSIIGEPFLPPGSAQR